MQLEHKSADVLAGIVAWAAAREDVRVVLLTSTRARPGGLVDVFSDYDVILVVVEVLQYWEDRSWLRDFGEPLAVYWDPMIAVSPGIEKTGNVAYFADGLHIDFSLWPVALLRQLVATPEPWPELDAGYTILLDKDGLAAGLPAPSYRAYIPARPSEAAFQTAIQEFWTDAPYVAKYLWRDELLPAKWALDHDMKHAYLRPMLEWYIQGRHGWSLPAGVLGRGLKQHLPADIWSELEQCYAGAGIDENWEALFRTLALYRRVALDVAADLGYTYPLEQDRGINGLVRAIRAMPHSSPGA